MLSLLIEPGLHKWFHMLTTNEKTNTYFKKETKPMHKAGTRIATKAAVAAIATSLLIGGAQVFAAERLNDGDTVHVELDGYNTKTNYTFVPETDGNYMFSTTNLDNTNMRADVRIYQGSTLIGTFGEGSIILNDLEAGRSYQIQARETGLRRGMEGGYDLAVVNVTPAPEVIDESPIPDELPPVVIYMPEDDSTTDDGVVELDLTNITWEEPETTVATPVASTVVSTPTVTATVTSTSTSVTASQAAMVEGFVNRLYDTVLGRQADQDGKTYWVNQLTTAQASGSAVASGFLNSQEFLNRNLNNEDFVKTLYKVFFNRVPSVTETANWVNALENGTTRNEVISGFAASSEWSNTCAGFGIVK